MGGGPPLVALVDGSSSTTNPLLEQAWLDEGINARILRPSVAADVLRPGDVAIGRIDVRPTVDGVEPGLLELLTLVRRRIRVVNRPHALLAAHDKLLTARRLAAARLPHPWTLHLRPGEPPPAGLEPPLVVKPRFGSWGHDVLRCETLAELDSSLAALAGRSWFRRQGVLLQELVPPLGHDLRVLVAAGRVVGAIRRRAHRGEWRTNYALGGTLEPVVPPPDACMLAVAAAAAIGGDFVGVDLLPVEHGWVVVEVNGAVDFKPAYSLPGRSVFATVADALALPRSGAEHLPVERLPVGGELPLRRAERDAAGADEIVQPVLQPVLGVVAGGALGEEVRDVVGTAELERDDVVELE